MVTICLGQGRTVIGIEIGMKKATTAAQDLGTEVEVGLRRGTRGIETVKDTPRRLLEETEIEITTATNIETGTKNVIGITIDAIEIERVVETEDSNFNCVCLLWRSAVSAIDSI